MVGIPRAHDRLPGETSARPLEATEGNMVDLSDLSPRYGVPELQPLYVL